MQNPQAIKINKRTMLATSVALGGAALTGCAGVSAANPARVPSDSTQTGFVRRDGTRLTLDGKAYRFAGANIWYGAYLGADAGYGDRARLGRELDRLKSLGVSNLRILASAEEGPLQHAIKPGFRSKDGWNETLLRGLDQCLAEVGKRGMKAVLYLSNFWEWSGGFGTYLWYTTGNYMNMGDPAHPWPEFPDHNAGFYRTPAAVAMFHEHVRKLVARSNHVTGIAYKDDPTIMAWQLCNEPRPGGTEPVIVETLPAYYEWIRSSAQLIRSLDSNHLVSLGHEGTIATGDREERVAEAHSHIDYVTAHIWPLNWGWVNGKDLRGTWEAGAAKVSAYLKVHEGIARSLNKPLVFEEFGFPRDGELYDPSAGTSFRERYYRMIYDAVETSVAQGGPISGSNFWAWNGEARAQHADHRFQEGDHQYMGDPPHEPQGWYGNFDSDQPMLELIRRHAEKLRG
ncbi:MAG TPA: beta-mannosidase [Polyangiaceae bacterium]|nr:beta-mannosidase [Polyangiaceae bacterium]